MSGPAPDATMTARQVIDLLGLQPHPEGGYFAESYRDTPQDGGRGACTAIYFLLGAGDVSAWHRVDAAEIWHWYAGAPLALTISPDGHDTRTVQLGTGLAQGQRPQAVVPADAWQTAVSLGDWTLVGCTVAPAFRFEGFELAPPGWHPTPRS
ncbi:cupin domain-containing protein [Arenibaculum pallidiluteum]|uniref:cupin domain-containing protein n=1 Tax=Arenibaculum pallidiluteum TaxID=2812559 RepID=UPI001A9725FD|nr:cupin domain-containing protein [Arenibaculum pallidiluteum]